MKRLFALTAFVALAACSVHAQVTDTTVCDVIKNPASFDGKTVRIKGTIVAGFDQFVLNDGDCGKEISGIWLAYPAGSKAKAGPTISVELAPAKNFAGTATAINRAPVTLTKDKEFKQFDSALSPSHSNGFMCLGCSKYTVQATITGRLDGVKSAEIQRANNKITGLGGFGNMNGYPARLVIASVADVTTKEVDYAKADAAAKAAQKAPGGGQQGPPGQASGTPSFADAKTAAEALVSRMAAGQITSLMQKDLSLLPKPKEQNGINIQNGIANEVAANEGAAGAVDSPDGVIYNCVLNRDKLQNNGIMTALIHVAQHVADVRSPIAGNEQAPLAILENNAWAVTTTMAIFGGERLITIQGGYVMWNAGWTVAERTEDMQSAQRDFLAKEALLNR